jgi:hypothetical protein
LTVQYTQKLQNVPRISVYIYRNCYLDIPHHLRNASRRKPPEKWRTNSWFLLHNNAPAHLSVLFKDFLAEIKVTTMKHTPYSPDLAAADFLPVPSTEISIGGTVLL